MYTYRPPLDGYIKIEKSVQGETIETKVRRLIQEKEPIKDGAPLIYTDRKDGVNAAYNIRTDRWEIATDVMTRLEKSRQAKRDELIKREGEAKEAKVIDINKIEPTHGKTGNGSS